MNRIFSLFILLVFLSSSGLVGATGGIVILKPNLNVQMKQQEQVNKDKVTLEKKIANTEKLKNLKLNKKTVTTKTSSTKTTPRVTLKEKVLAAKANGSVTPIEISAPVITAGVTNITGVDMTRVRTEWLSWYNSTRRDLGLVSYNYDSRLDTTAHSWNMEFAAGKGQNHHRRTPTDSYYNFNTITEWFRTRGVEGVVSGGATTTENVGYGYYNCRSSDCTDSLISSIRTTYDFFMSEKGKSYDAHYRSIVQPNFTKIGLDIIVVPEEYRYYITVHYITEFE